MKVKFEFTEEMRMKAYYALQLQRRLDNELPSDISFDVWANCLAEVAFVEYLDDMIKSYNDILERSLQNAKKNEAI